MDKATIEAMRDAVNPGPPVQGSIVEALDELREVVGKAWDAIEDPEKHLHGDD